MPEDSHSPSVGGSPEKPLTGRTILLVEDECFIADLLVSWLGRLGATTIRAETGNEGIRQLADHAGHVSAVIADFRLPDMSGDDMCIKLREIQPQLPVLLSSGRYHGQAEELLARSGPTCFIQKPYPLEDVLIKLQKIFGAA